MKYIAFALVALVGVPVMSAAGIASRRARTVLYALLLLSLAATDQASINFVSNEDYRGADRGFEVTLTELIALALVVALFAARGVRHRGPLIAPMTGAFALYFVAAAASAVVAYEPLYSLFSLWKLPRIYVVFLAVYLGLTREDDIETAKEGLWWGIALTGLYIGLLAVQQKYLWGMYRITGPFDHSNTVPIFLHHLAPLLLAWTVAETRFERPRAWLGVASVLAMLFSVVATQSRAGMALSGAGILAALVIAARNRPSARAKAVSVALAVVFLIGGVLAMDTILFRFRNAPESSEEARNEFNEAAVMMANEHPLGVGINNFSSVLTSQQRYRENIVVMANEDQAGVAHHIYLLTAAEIGWAGLAALVLILIRFAVFPARLFAMAPDSIHGMIGAGILVGMLAVHATGFVEWALRITPASYALAIVAAIPVGLYTRERHHA